MIEHPIVVRASRRRYNHRPIITVVENVGITEHGELIEDLVEYAATSSPHLWIIDDCGYFLQYLLGETNDGDGWQIQTVVSSESEVRTAMKTTKLTRFGLRDKGSRRQGLHTVWSPKDIARTPGEVRCETTHEDMRRFAVDIRSFCKENDIPIPTSGLSGIPAHLLRSDKFWGDRGRVPRATNETVRPHLPGVFTQLFAKPQGKPINAVALDQSRAYHRAASEIPLPDSTTLFAKGYFHDPYNSPIWTATNNTQYHRIISQPGLVALRVTSRKNRKEELRPRSIDFNGVGTAYLWTNELDVATDIIIHGIVAAWTSTYHCEGLPRYAKWAFECIDKADEQRAQWLKPTLHMAYGMLGSRPRDIEIGFRHGNGKSTKHILSGREFATHGFTLQNLSPPITNVTALGVLQAEVRARTIRRATALIAEGFTVTCVHSDSIHILGQLPLCVDSEWKMHPLSDLVYIDRNSWLANERDTLPGRTGQYRKAEREKLVSRIFAPYRSSRSRTG